MRVSAREESTRTSLPLTSHQAQEIDQLITSLRGNTIDVAGLDKLISLSKDRPVDEIDYDDELDNGAESPSKSMGASFGQFWTQDKRFARLYEALAALLVKRDLVSSSFETKFFESSLCLTHSSFIYHRTLMFKTQPLHC